MKKQVPYQQERIEWLNQVSSFLDNRFRIPGTNTRFGIDFLVGLVPYVGDLASFVASSLLVLTMVRYGASGRVIIQMIWNIFLDAVVGAIPLVGDIFDLYYKANRRNFELLQAHYTAGTYQGNGLWIIGLVLLFLIGLFIFTLWLVYKAGVVTWSFLQPLLFG